MQKKSPHPASLKGEEKKRRFGQKMLKTLFPRSALRIPSFFSPPLGGDRNGSFGASLCSPVEASVQKPPHLCFDHSKKRGIVEFIGYFTDFLTQFDLKKYILWTIWQVPGKKHIRSLFSKFGMQFVKESVYLILVFIQQAQLWKTNWKNTPNK